MLTFQFSQSSFCLDTASLTLDRVDYIVFYEKPMLKFERLLETYVAFAPVGFSSFRRAIPAWVKEKLFLPNIMRKHLKSIPGNYNKPFFYLGHHESHAASAFFPSPFQRRLF